MANSRTQVNINLIGKQPSALGQDFLKWSFNAGRIIIVLTELIALFALSYRFYIDRRIIDLHDQINRGKILVEAQGEKEEIYRNIQNRLANIKETEKVTKIKINIMNNILSSVSSGNFSSTNLTIDQSNIRFNGTAFSIFPINSFIEDLKRNPNVASISLDDISSTNQGIQFKIMIELDV